MSGENTVSSEAVLFEVVTVHCCWCPFLVRAGDPRAAHDLMEGHYAVNHRVIIDRFCVEASQ